jgi:rhodanese-related sulfurtransferase
MTLQMVSVMAMMVMGFVAAAVWSAIRARQKRRQEELERHTITPEQLSRVLEREPQLSLFDLRQPLEVLADSEMIPGARRICPHKVLENPWLIPRDKAAVVYCTSSNDEISRVILQRVLSMGFVRVRILKGGLNAWKAKGYAVERYFGPIRVDVAS